MSVSSIPVETRNRLWGKAAGRCQYAGCNDPLWRDDLTQAEFNSSYIAHIVADKPKGPRGDEILSPELAQELSNLMLLCDKHHRLVDVTDKNGHPAEWLLQMKADHENRIELLCSLRAEKRSEVILYGANIGQHSSPLIFGRCAQAMLPRYYPASSTGITLGMKGSANRDDHSLFWQAEESHLRNQFRERIKPRLDDGSLAHFSLFALAPQPLLILLGHLLNDLPTGEIYQKHREPDSWAWPVTELPARFNLEAPARIVGQPALVLSISATVQDERIYAVMGPKTSVWKIRVASPHNDVLKSPEQLRDFRQLARRVFDRIKTAHGESATLHVFPAVPSAIAVELGRVRMPKADLPLKIFDQNARAGGFIPALDIA